MGLKRREAALGKFFLNIFYYFLSPKKMIFDYLGIFSYAIRIAYV